MAGIKATEQHKTLWLQIARCLSRVKLNFPSQVFARSHRPQLMTCSRSLDGARWQASLAAVNSFLVCCRLLAFCAHVAARLPFKRCDEPYTLMHLINGTISRRAAFVLSAQKATLNTTGAQGPGQPDAHPSTAPFQEGPAEERDTVAAPGGGDGPMQREGGAQQSAVSGAEGAAAETPGEAVRDQVGRPPAMLKSYLCSWALAVSLTFHLSEGRVPKPCIITSHYTSFLKPPVCLSLCLSVCLYVCFLILASMHPFFDAYTQQVLLLKATSIMAAQSLRAPAETTRHQDCLGVRFSPLPQTGATAVGTPLVQPKILALHLLDTGFTPSAFCMQGQTAPQKGREGPSGRSRKQSTAGAPGGRAECTASLALTMLLMLKRYLKATYSMSEDRIAAFSPDLPDKRKQVRTLSAAQYVGSAAKLGAQLAAGTRSLHRKRNAPVQAAEIAKCTCAWLL